jgi:DNA replication and repair protein RecF
VWVERLEVYDLRNIAEARFDLGPGLNVFVGRNAQGKTSLLEAVGLLARGRSFRTENTGEAVRRGASALRTRGTVVRADRRVRLEVEVAAGDRRLAVDGRDVPPREYQGRLEAAVYATDRLRVVRGPMRERRLFLDRGAAALWPRYRQTVRDFERVLRQRNAALERGRDGLDVWDEQFVTLGAALRQRRGEYVERLGRALGAGFAPGGERYGVALSSPPPARGEAGQREVLQQEIEERRRDERRARRSLAGPHRDTVALSVDGEDSAGAASSGQARSLLLALILAALAVYREERGEAAVALLDDLDSELDQERTAALCREVAARGQALVTSAHEGWVRSLGDEVRMFRVEGGRVAEAGASMGVGH